MVLESETIAAQAVGAEGAEGIRRFLRSARRTSPARVRAEARGKASRDVVLRRSLVGALGIILVLRIYFKLRAAGKSRGESWDEQMIARLRSQGYAPFNDYPVDFFLALPDEAAVQAVRARLEPEFAVDARKPLQTANSPSACTPASPCA